jgi:hypothetical protein
MELTGHKSMDGEVMGGIMKRREDGIGPVKLTTV